MKNDQYIVTDSYGIQLAKEYKNYHKILLNNPNAFLNDMTIDGENVIYNNRSYKIYKEDKYNLTLMPKDLEDFMNSQYFSIFTNEDEIEDTIQESLTIIKKSDICVKNQI